jgi:hypothetical protein
MLIIHYGVNCFYTLKMIDFVWLKNQTVIFYISSHYQNLITCYKKLGIIKFSFSKLKFEMFLQNWVQI